MNFESAKKSGLKNETFKQFAIICGFFFGACVLGLTLITVGGGSNSQTLALGALALMAIGAVVCNIL